MSPIGVWDVASRQEVTAADRRQSSSFAGGASLGSWTAGGLNQPQGIATDETDIWILDGKHKRVYHYIGAASLTSGSQNPASNFALAGSNKKPKGITTDGISIWVVYDDKHSDVVFKYDTSGTLLGSWIIDSANAKPTGITVDSSGASNSVWIVDAGAHQVFEYPDGKNDAGGTLNPTGSFDLAAGNTNPQGIADPPPNNAGSDGYGLPDKSQHTIPHIAAVGTSNTSDGSDSVIALPMFTILSTSDPETSTSGTNTDDSVVLVERVQQAALPNEDDTSAELSDDALTDEEPANERIAIDVEAFDDLFADFNGNLLDDLLAV